VEPINEDQCLDTGSQKLNNVMPRLIARIIGASNITALIGIPNQQLENRVRLLRAWNFESEHITNAKNIAADVLGSNIMWSWMAVAGDRDPPAHRFSIDDNATGPSSHMPNIWAAMQ
jgi:hypothetical protein